MQTITIWLKTIQDTDITKGGSSLSAGDLSLLQRAIGIGSKVLQRYLSQIISAARLAGSFQANVGLDPNDDQVGNSDALVYLTTSSLARDFAARNSYILSGGSADGATAPFPEGALSEIYIPSIKRHGSDDVHRGTVLANLAIHEIAHNKCCADPTIPNQNDYVHQNGGGGLLGLPIMPALLRSGGLNATNISFMAPRIGKQVPQLTSYLFSARLGF
jgi:hypothetical protein